MRRSVGMSIRRLACGVIAEDSCLSAEEILAFNTKGPILVHRIKKNKKDPIGKLKPEEKRLLLAYIVYLRQNLTSAPIDNPNDEDAAKIIHEEAFPSSDKDADKEIGNELKKQLAKAGIKIDEQK